MTASWLLQDALLLPMDGPPERPLGDVRTGSLRIAGDRITAIGDLQPLPGETIVPAAGLCALPGFVQGHVHCCQTLFRGLADGLPLLPWLQQRIWPLEHAHDEVSTHISAELTVAELLHGGTTTVMTMESVRHTDACLQVLAHSPLTAISGNCLMDQADPAMPLGMATTAATALQWSERLHREFHGRGRLQYALAPRFVLSCSEGLLRDVAALARQWGARVHTHADEHPDEVAAVRAATGRDYLQVLADLDLLHERTALAHCVHLTEAEFALLRGSGAAVLHCPSTNLKLGSGIAHVARLLAAGVPLAFGADGAPCNNRLSALAELRLAALLQDLQAGPGAVPAARWLWQATAGGAQALGIPDVGRLVPGHRADVVLFALDRPGLVPGTDPAGAIVYAGDERQLRHVLCGGRFVVRDGALQDIDGGALAARAVAARDAVLSRAGLRR